MSDIVLVRVEAISLFTLARGQDRRMKNIIGIILLLTPSIIVLILIGVQYGSKNAFIAFGVLAGMLVPIVIGYYLLFH